ncbi:MAG: TetR/AcrR family transcriptional regulator [Pseudomonadota bacterium]
MAKLAETRKAEWDLVMKNAIYEATVAVLNQHGFDGLRMDRVAKKAEVATGTLYNYFKNKAELLRHVIDTRFKPINHDFLEILKSAISPEEKLGNFVRIFLNSIKKYRSLMIIVTTAESLSLPIKAAVDEKREIGQKLLADVIKEGIAQGKFRHVNPMQTARLIFGALFGIIQPMLGTNEEIRNDDSDLSDCMTFFSSGLFKIQ